MLKKKLYQTSSVTMKKFMYWSLREEWSLPAIFFSCLHCILTFKRHKNIVYPIRQRIWEKKFQAILFWRIVKYFQNMCAPQIKVD